jgi:hypothetical protein
VADRVFLHIGVPKSGTTHLQSLLWRNREALEQQQVLLPGRNFNDHRWGSLCVREDPRLRHRGPSSAAAWDRIVEDVDAWPATAVISHEFYGGASEKQAERAVEALAPAEVHLVVTARNPLVTLTSAWQEMAKYGNAESIEEFSLVASANPAEVWNWRSLDPAEVLGRWSATVPAERVHVLAVSSESTRQGALWRRFASLFSQDLAAFDTDEHRANKSIGLVESEVMRRVGAHLEDLTALPRSRWLRGYLAETVLAERPVERFWPSPRRIEECRARGARAVEAIRDAGFDVDGNLADLLVPEELAERRTPSDVSEEEVAAVEAEVLARLLRDLRKTTRRQHRREQEIDQEPDPEREPEPEPEREKPARGSVVRRLFGRLRA